MNSPGEVYFFGCWNEAGHYLFLPGGRSPHGDMLGDRFCWAEAPDGERFHVDCGLAPRRLEDGSLCWNGQSTKTNRIAYRSKECPQGQALRHEMNGHTMVSWWDRCQGDTRPNCNSTLIVRGSVSFEEAVRALRVHFPHVLENLERGGPDIERMRARRSEFWKPPENQGRVELVEVRP